jgi:hypothetical protein
MEYALAFTLLTVIMAGVWLGAWIAQDRGRVHKGWPESTEGGEPTIYRRPGRGATHRAT